MSLETTFCKNSFNFYLRFIWYLKLLFHLIWKNYVLYWDFDLKSWIVDFFSLDSQCENIPQNSFSSQKVLFPLKPKKTWNEPKYTLSSFHISHGFNCRAIKWVIRAKPMWNGPKYFDSFDVSHSLKLNRPFQFYDFFIKP